MAAARATDQIQFLQLYVEKDRAASKTTVEKANELGFSGLFLTVFCLLSIPVIYILMDEYCWFPQRANDIMG